MRIDWNKLDSFKRLLAAMVAAQDLKLNYAKIAAMYGQGATYDAVEGHFRKIRKDAAQLREEHAAAAASSPWNPASAPIEKPPRRQRAKLPSRKGTAEAGSTVLTGRVKKNSASKKRQKAIKEETAEDVGGETDVEAELLGSSQEGTSFGMSFGGDDGNDDTWLSSQSVYDPGFAI